jgi:hypothetical protein
MRYLGMTDDGTATLRLLLLPTYRQPCSLNLGVAMYGYLSSLWPFKRDVPLPDDPPPPYPGAMSREQVLAHVEYV